MAKRATPRETLEQKLAPSASKPEATRPPPATSSIETLLGSSTLASTFEIGGRTVQLGEIVQLAFTATALSLEDWNKLPDAERDTWLNQVLERMRVEAEEAEAANSPAKASEAQPAEAQSAQPEGDASRPGREGGVPASVSGTEADDISAEVFAEIDEQVRVVTESVRAEAAAGNLDVALAHLRSERANAGIMREAAERVDAALAQLQSELTGAPAEPLAFTSVLAAAASPAIDEGAAIDGAQQVGHDEDAVPVRVTGPRDGRWRAKRLWGVEPVEVLATAEELAALEADPMLKVERLPF